MCCCTRAVRLLLWRNCVRRKRAKCATCVELFSPVFIVIMFVLIYKAFSDKTRPATQYLDNRDGVPNLAGLAYRLQLYNANFGIGKSQMHCCAVTDSEQRCRCGATPSRRSKNTQTPRHLCNAVSHSKNARRLCLPAACCLCSTALLSVLFNA